MYRSCRYGSRDTAVYRDRFRYGRRIKWQDPWKPVDYDDAYNTLNSLSGQTHNVYTGVSIMYYDGEKCRTKTFYENTEVTFYPMTHEEIVGYLATGDPFDKAGSYGIQTQGGLFVKGIKGSYDNVVGLPLSRLYHELNEMLYGQ